LGLGLELPDIGPNRSWAKLFKKPKRIGFGQWVKAQTHSFYFSSLSFIFFFFFTPMYLTCAAKGSFDFSSFPPFSPELYRIFSLFFFFLCWPCISFLLHSSSSLFSSSFLSLLNLSFSFLLLSLLTSPYALSLQLLSFISFSLHFFFFGG
jgi:hypothetical protein